MYNSKRFNNSCKHVCKLPLFLNFFGFLEISLLTLSLLSKNLSKEISTMLIIDSKDCENIDKALKKYKKKFEKSKVLLQLRERQSYVKPSVERRTQVLKAVYRQKMANGEIES